MRKLGLLGIALVGVLLFVSALGFFWLPLSVAFSDVGNVSKVFLLLLASLPFFAALGGGYFLLTRRESLATRLFPESDSPIAAAPEDLLRVGLVLIGVYLFAEAIPSFVGQILMPVIQIFEINAGLGDGIMTTSDVVGQLTASLPNVLSALARFGVGWFLLARSAQLTQRLFASAGDHDEPEQGLLPECPSCGEPYDPSDYIGGSTEAQCASCKQPLPVAHA